MMLYLLLMPFVIVRFIVAFAAAIQSSKNSSCVLYVFPL